MVVQFALIRKAKGLIPFTPIEPVEPAEKYSEEEYSNQKHDWTDEATVGNIGQRVISFPKLSYRVLDGIDDDARSLDG